MTRQGRAAWTFTAPVLVLMLIVTVVPALGALALSVTDFDIYGLGDAANVRFIGLANYVELLTDPLFWTATGNTIVFAALGVPAAVGLSLAAALLIDAATVRWKPVWRLMLFAPYITTLVASSVVWSYLLNTRNGLINAVLARVGIAPLDWLGDPRLSIPAVTIFIVWKVFGYNMIVFTAALSTVSAELGDAARLDGAGRLDRFRHVTLPAIGPAVLLALVLSIASFLQLFTEPYVMTHGGPAGSTVTVLYFMFDQGFEWWSLGKASAVAVLLFVAILGVTAVQVRVGQRQEWV